MHISPKVLRLSLLRLFADAAVGPEGCLSFAEVSMRWPQTGLRGDDLRDAVRELLDSGDLLASGEDDGLHLSLSPEALRGLREPYGELHLATFEDEAALFMARHRVRGNVPPDPLRRARDRKEPVLH
jgi:hypothetical protein